MTTAAQIANVTGAGMRLVDYTAAEGPATGTVAETLIFTGELVAQYDGGPRQEFVRGDVWFDSADAGVGDPDEGFVCFQCALHSGASSMNLIPSPDWRARTAR